MSISLITKALALFWFAGIFIGGDSLASCLTIDFEISSEPYSHLGLSNIPFATHLGSFVGSPPQANSHPLPSPLGATYYKVDFNLQKLNNNRKRDEVSETFFSKGKKSLKASTSPFPVPEPSTILLFGAGLIGIAGIARRRTKKNL